jgi:protein TonB
MFDSIVENKRKRKWVPWLLGGSLGLHAVAVLAVLFLDQLRVSPVPEPAVTITFVDLASAPPPPPPPPPPKKRSEPKREVKPVERKAEAPKELMAPKEIPQQKEEPKDEEPEDTGSDEGVEGGVEGGVAGGVVGGAATAPPPPPPPPPPAPPTFQEIETVRKRRIAGSEPGYPPIALRNEIEGVVVAKLTIGPDGNITEIVFTKTHPAFERTVRESLAGWRFSPHKDAAGRPVSIFTLVKFTFKLE